MSCLTCQRVCFLNEPSYCGLCYENAARRWHWLIDLAYTNWVGPFYGLSWRMAFEVNKPKPADNELRPGHGLMPGDVVEVTGGPASMIGQRFRVGIS